MIVENVTRAGSTEDTISFSDIKGYQYRLQFGIGTDPTNCKLSYIHGIGNLSLVKNSKEKKEIIEHLLKKCKGYVIINTINKEVSDFIFNNFQSYYYIKVPVGYSSGYQYNIAIKNCIVPNANCKVPSEIINNTVTTVNNKVSNIDLNTIKTRLKILLRNKRRKDDYVDQFFKDLE